MLQLVFWKLLFRMDSVISLKRFFTPFFLFFFFFFLLLFLFGLYHISITYDRLWRRRRTGRGGGGGGRRGRGRRKSRFGWSWFIWNTSCRFWAALDGSLGGIKKIRNNTINFLKNKGKLGQFLFQLWSRRWRCLNCAVVKILFDPLFWPRDIRLCGRCWGILSREEILRSGHLSAALAVVSGSGCNHVACYIHNFLFLFVYFVHIFLFWSLRAFNEIQAKLVAFTRSRWRDLTFFFHFNSLLLFFTAIFFSFIWSL